MEGLCRACTPRRQRGQQLAAALGFSVLFAVSEAVFDAVRWAGAGYLLVLGLRSLQGAASPRRAPPPALDVAPAYRRALITNLLNPKSALFFLGFLPQFADPARGHLFRQIVSLGAIAAERTACIASMQSLYTP